MKATGTRLVRYIRTLAAAQADNPCTDQQLLEQFAMRREQASFAALVRRHGPMVLGVCRRVLGHDQDAEDAFQATFLVLAKKAGSIRKQESISSWLHGVAYHVAEKLRAKEARRVVHERKAASRLPVDPAEEVAWSEIRCLLDSELARLPERYRGPLVLCYLQGKTQDEAARQLEWSLSTLRRRLDQARQILACRLKRRGLALSAALTAPILLENPATAGLPPLLAATTVRAGLAAALGNTVGGMVSEQVVAIAEGGVGSLLVKKASIAFVLLVSLMLGMGGLLAYRAAHSRTFAEVPAAPTAQSPPARSASKELAIEITGRVLGPDDKPVAGATVYLIPKDVKTKADLRLRTATDKEGAFRLTAAPADMQGGARLLATAPGHGPDWVDVNKAGETTLRLVKDDVPIQGRVIDLEGQPIAGVTVAVDQLAKPAEGNLTPWLKDQTQQGRDWRRAELPMKYLWPALLDGPQVLKSDADGRFRMTGFGRERLVILDVSGPTIESYSHVRVLTRSGTANSWATDYDRIHAASFDFAAAPSKPIIGTVRDKITGKALAGIHVKGWSGRTIGSFNGNGHAVTDELGRYRLTGISKNNEYTIVAGGLSYFNVTKEQISDTPGLAPIEVNFELQRGILVRGRLKDKTTGKSLTPGYIGYFTPTDNPHCKDYPDFKSRSFNPLPPREHLDGSFSVLAIPGPGWLGVRAEEEDRYVGFEFKDCDERLLRALIAAGSHPNRFHAIVPINLSEKEPQSTTPDIALEPGHARPGIIVGPDGKPLTGVRVAGLSPVAPLVYQPAQGLKDASVIVSGLSPCKERTLVFFHPGQKLGKIIHVRGDEKGPLTIQLESLGAITGRAFPGITVEAEISRDIRDYKDLPGDVAFISVLGPLLKVKQKADREGRFRIDSLLPGLRYNLKPVYREGLTVESGKTKDLGTISEPSWSLEKGTKERP